MGCGGSKGAAFASSAAQVDLSTPRQSPLRRHQAAPGAAEPAQQPAGAAEPGPAPGPAAQEAHPSRRRSVEEARLRTLYELGALNQARKRQLDSLASLVRGLLGVEGAFVVLVEADQVVAAGSAVEQSWRTSVPRGGSVSEFMLRADAPALLVVEDASQDPRFQDALMVAGPPYIRFVALVPLVASDSSHRYGALAVADTRPRPGGLAPEQTALLQKFADMAVQELEREKSLQRQQQELAAVRQQRHVVRALDGLQEAMCVLDTGQPQWPIAYANKAWEDATGVERKQAALRAAGFWGLFALASVRPQQQQQQQEEAQPRRPQQAQQQGPLVGDTSCLRSVRFPEANLPLAALAGGRDGVLAGTGSASGTSGSMSSSAGSAAASAATGACPSSRFGAVALAASSHQGSDGGLTSAESAAAAVSPSSRIVSGSAAAAAAASGGCGGGSSSSSGGGALGAARTPFASAGAPDSCAGSVGEPRAPFLRGGGDVHHPSGMPLPSAAAVPAASGAAGPGASEAERSARDAAVAGRAFDAVVQRSAAAAAEGGAAAGGDAAAQGSAGAAEQRAAARHLLFRFRPITGGDYFGSGLLSLNSASSADSTLGAAAAAATGAVQPGGGGSGGLAGWQQQAGGSGPGQQATGQQGAGQQGLPLGAPTAVPAADRGKGSSGGALPLGSGEAGCRYVATVRPFDPAAETLEGLSQPVNFGQQPQGPGLGSAGAAAGAGATPAALSPAASGSVGRRPGSRRFDYSSFELPQPSSIPDSPLVTSATTSSGDESKEVQGITFGPLIGQGAFGRCYRGTWQGASVAIKVMECSPSSPHGLGGERAIVEALLSRSLSHPHVCPTYDWRVVMAREDETPGVLPRKQILLIQRYCNRGSLIQAVEQGRLKRRDGQPDLVKILLTGIDIAGAIEYLHSAGIIHGDLSGNNVLLTSSSKDARRWIAQVADFGLSRALSGGVVQTSSLRTVTHMPPELLLDGVLTPAADIYSLGVLLCEMWTGERAWKGTGAVQVINAVTSSVGPGLEPPADMPPELQDLASACLARSPQDRPALKDVLSRLSRLLRDVKRQEGQEGQQPAAA